MKYKVGDKVRVRKDLVLGERYYMEDGVYHDTIVLEMEGFKGKTVTIKSADGKYRVEGSIYSWTDEMFEPVNARKIVITSDGEKTLARLYENNKVIKSATAKCSPDDTFDFEKGAKLAVDRLLGKTEQKEEYYNGKAVCVEKKPSTCYTVGKIYEFHDGRIIIDNGSVMPSDCSAPVTSLDDWNSRGSLLAKFIPLVED